MLDTIQTNAMSWMPYNYFYSRKMDLIVLSKLKDPFSFELEAFPFVCFQNNMPPSTYIHYVH